MDRDGQRPTDEDYKWAVLDIKEQAFKPLSSMTPDELNREFAERTGQCLHLGDVWVIRDVWTCADCHKQIDPNDPSPDYYHSPHLALRVMMGRSDFDVFLSHIGSWNGKDVELIELRYITEDGLLAKASLEWIRSH